MPMLIKGIRIDSVSLQRDENGHLKASGQYSLLSEQDVVLAKQHFNGYDSLKLEMSPDTQAALNQFQVGVKSDLEKILGFEGGK